MNGAGGDASVGAARLLVALAIVASLLSWSAPALANWTASGAVMYRDREWDKTGFTSVESLKPARYADVEVKDATSGSTLATGATSSSGAFSISVTDSSTRTLYLRIITNSTRTSGLYVKVVDATQAPYAIASSSVANHSSTTDVNFGTLSAWKIGRASCRERV